MAQLWHLDNRASAVYPAKGKSHCTVDWTICPHFVQQDQENVQYGKESMNGAFYSLTKTNIRLVLNVQKSLTKSTVQCKPERLSHNLWMSPSPDFGNVTYPDPLSQADFEITILTT